MSSTSSPGGPSRVRDATGTVVQEVDVSAGDPVWFDDLGLAGFPWPLTRDTTARREVPALGMCMGTAVGPEKG